MFLVYVASGFARQSCNLVLVLESSNQYLSEGYYTVCAHNQSVCDTTSDTVTVKVPPPTPTNVEGPVVVCPGATATYSSVPTSSEYYLHWEWNVDGTPHSYTGNEVNVNFGETVGDILVYQVCRRHGCMSEPLVYHVAPFRIAAWPYTEQLKVCQGQVIHLDRLQDQSAHGVLYEWTVVDNPGILSIQNDHLTAHPKLLANFSSQLPRVAHLRLERRYCNSRRFNYVNVRVDSINPPGIEHGQVRAGRTVDFTVPTPNDANSEQTCRYVNNANTGLTYGVPGSLSFSDTTAPTFEPELSGCTTVNGAFTLENTCYNMVRISELSALGLTYPLQVTLTKDGVSRQFTVGSNTENFMVPGIGVYNVSAHWNYQGTCYTSTVEGTIVEAVKIWLKSDCGHNLKIYHQVDGTATAVDFQVRGNGFNQTNQRVVRNSLDSVEFRLPASGSYVLSLKVILVDEAVECTFDTTIRIYFRPDIINLNLPRIVCENTPVTFQASVDGEQLDFNWDFGDASSNVGNGIDHVYKNQPFSPVVLTVTDKNGCSSSASTGITVVRNPMKGFEYELDVSHVALCSGDSTVIISLRNDGFSYRWSPCHWVSGSFANVYKAGNYMVEITSLPGQCKRQFGINAPYPNSPLASIHCKSSYCYGEEISILGGVGSEFTYNWTVTSAHTSASASTSTLNLLLTDTGYYRVILSITDRSGCSSSDTATFRVHPTPAVPTPDFIGSPCLTEGAVTIRSTNGRELLWSNGTKGDVDQCNLRYHVIVEVCNRSSNPISIDNIIPTVPVPYTLQTTLPLLLNPNDCEEIEFDIIYGFPPSSTYSFQMVSGGTIVGLFSVDFADWMECLQVDTCSVRVTPSLTLDHSLSQTGQSVFFNFSLLFSSPVANVFSVQSAYGQIIDGQFLAPDYRGLLMLDYGLLTQMMADETDFWFHLVCCHNDKLCIVEVCIPYRVIWELCMSIQNKSSHSAYSESGSADIAPAEKAFILAPNPATGTVRVLEVQDDRGSDEITRIEVYSLLGQRMLVAEATSVFDVSQLANGTYIVKVVTTDNTVEYLKMVKQ